MESTRKAASIPVACVPLALTGEERARSAELRQKIAADIGQFLELPDGYAFRLSGDPEGLRSVAEWVPLERRCCPFLEFRLSWLAGADHPELALIGPEGTKEFLHGEIPSIQDMWSAGGFDVTTGDVQRLAGRAPRSLEDARRNARL
jgi:hypothetical protein